MGSCHKHLKSHLHSKTVLKKKPRVYICFCNHSSTIVMSTVWKR